MNHEQPNQTVWIFHGEQGRFSSGVFSSVDIAEKWISKHKLSGVLTEYPLNVGVYDWAIENDFFTVKKDSQEESKFIQNFTTANQEHFHYQDGLLD